MDAAALAAAASKARDAAFGDPRNYINRELSTLAFHERVLEQACDPSVPLLERLKFLGIFSTDLDEFFMIRVAGLKQQLVSHVEERGPDAMSPAEQLAAISQRVHALAQRHEKVLLEDILPRLEAAGFRLLRPRDLAAEPHAILAEYFQREVLPVLTPLALDPGHPFPHLRNKSLNLCIRFAAGARLHYGVVPVPAVLPRLVPVASAFVLLEDVIALHVAQLFPEAPIEGCWAFRVTRNWDLNIDEEEAEDLLVTIEREVRRRDRGSAVRLQINASTGNDVSRFLAQALHLGEDDVYHLRRPLALQEFVPTLISRPELKALQGESFTPVLPAAVADPLELLQLVRQRDVLLHHPYESFEPVVSFIEWAADDPDVLAIKIALYRAGRDNPIVRALQRAAENGKQVTALVELKARMDEEANIVWARQLEQAGVQVVYGLIGYKTHCKIVLVLRRESGILRRYVHLGTGNYNPATARAYSDLSFFTAREDFGADATALFNLLTGYSRPASWRKFLVAPLGLKSALLSLIAEEAQAGEHGRIIAKMNALADPEVIQALCAASQAGVLIDLLVRGICCLRPGVPGVSERIRVTSVVDRFLEHARIWFFQAKGAGKLFLSSGDWMQRNFVRRVDVAFPVEDAALKERIVGEILSAMLADNQRAWVLRPDGRYERVQPGTAAPLFSQEQLMALARRSAISDVSRPASVETLLGSQGRGHRRKRS
jgi:polyphosphate kinase